ncbi:MAG: carboxypeptidase M32, partial [Candidatus Colwellbacteria bacterium]|nr:carboxypeptidase M32 [Candidatus Colwellbacteria bacterium]
LYAAQFYAAALRDVPSLESEIASGRIQPLLGWLREKIHRHGRRMSASELVVSATGKPLSSEHFAGYLARKYGELYTRG